MLILEPGECLYIPAGWFHETETLPGESPDEGDVSATVNFFASACFAALGVIVPDLQHLGQIEPNWVPGLEPGSWRAG